MENQSSNTEAESTQQTPSIIAPLKEEAETSIRKEGISYIFESRSVSAVINFVYTPIDGTFSDIELEINNTPPIKPAEEGGMVVEMGGRMIAADSEEVERHFISCEQLENCVEARWQWVVDEEIANFLYRFSISGKSLIVEVEGGNGKAAGVSLGRIIDAVNPKLIAVPYFNFGEHYPRLLCTAGTFVSSFLDWNVSQATTLYSVDEETALRDTRLNGGCTYEKNSNGQRAGLVERFVLTASTEFAEAFPHIDFPKPAAQADPSIAHKAWYSISHIEASEESYVEIYENLRVLKQMGIEDILVNHPDDTWHDGGESKTFTLTAAPIKGGDDALSEYIDAVDDLGFHTTLQTNFREISGEHPDWAPECSAKSSTGEPVLTAPNAYLYKPSLAKEKSQDYLSQLVEKYQPSTPYISTHASVAPWDFTDCDVQTAPFPTLSSSLRLQRELLGELAERFPCIGDGGNHWQYAGLLQGFSARMVGANPSQLPPLVDFDLQNLHGQHINAGLGTIDQYFGLSIPTEEKHSRSNYLSRYLAATAAFGHAVMLPDITDWGLASTVKSFFMLKGLQEQYLDAKVERIRYHQNGNLTTLNDALHSGAFELGQLRIDYENKTKIYANLGNSVWSIEEEDTTYELPAGSFWGQTADGDLLAYSSQTETGRLDFAQCSEYLFIDAHGTETQHGPISLDGAALVKERKWEIDVVPMDCKIPTIIDVAHFWPDRKLPPLRLLAFKMDEESPDIYKADMQGDKVTLPNIDGAYMYRITLPEWMVEPGH